MTEMYLRFNSVSAFDCVFFNGNDADGENFENDRKNSSIFKMVIIKMMKITFKKMVFDTKKQEQQYAEWLAACRLAAKGKTLADSR